MHVDAGSPAQQPDADDDHENARHDGERGEERRGHDRSERVSATPDEHHAAGVRDGDACAERDGGARELAAARALTGERRHRHDRLAVTGREGVERTEYETAEEKQHQRDRARAGREVLDRRRETVDAPRDRVRAPSGAVAASRGPPGSTGRVRAALVRRGGEVAAGRS